MERPRSEQEQLEQPKELVAADLRILEDTGHEWALEIARMHRNDDCAAPLRMDEVVVAAAGAGEAPASALEYLDELFGGDGREPLTHAMTVARSITGSGTGQPSASSVSRYPAIASLTLASASSRVSPCVHTPGRSGTETTKPPSSARSKTTSNLRG